MNRSRAALALLLLVVSVVAAQGDDAAKKPAPPSAAEAKEPVEPDAATSERKAEAPPLPKAGSVAAPTEATSEALRTFVEDSRFSDAMRTFSALPHPSADDEYLAGYALMELNRPDEAAPHLYAAKA